MTEQPSEQKNARSIMDYMQELEDDRREQNAVIRDLQRKLIMAATVDHKVPFAAGTVVGASLMGVAWLVWILARIVYG